MSLVQRRDHADRVQPERRARAGLPVLGTVGLSGIASEQVVGKELVAA